MKKVLFCFLAVFCFLLFNSCEYFSNGTALKNQIEDIIAYENQSNPLKVISHLPEFKNSGSCKDSPIVITFNKPIKPETFEFNVVSTLGSDFTSYYKYYGTIEFLDGNKTVKITPFKYYLPYFSEHTCDVVLTVPGTVRDSNNIIMSKDYSWSFRLSDKTDDEGPSVVYFNVSRTEDGAKEEYDLLSSNLKYEEWEYSDFYLNRLKDVWVSARVYDEVSGPAFVRYCITPVKYLDGTLYTGEKNKTGFYADFEQSSVQNGYADIVFKCDFEQLAASLGESLENTCNMYSLDFEVCDNNLNPSESISRLIIYDNAGPDTSQMKIFSTPEPFSNVSNGKGDYTFFISRELKDNWYEGSNGCSYLSELELCLLDEKGKIIPDVSIKKEPWEVDFFPFLNSYAMRDLMNSGRYLEEEALKSFKGQNGSEELTEYWPLESYTREELAQVTIPDVSISDGLYFSVCAKDEFENATVVPLAVPGKGFDMGIYKTEPVPESDSVLKYSGVKTNVVFDDENFNAGNLVRYSSIDNINYYRFTGDYSFLNTLSPEDFPVNDPVCDAVQQIVYFDFSDDSYIYLYGYMTPVSELKHGTESSEGVLKIKDVRYSDAELSAGKIKVYVDYDAEKFPASYIQVYAKRTRKGETVYSDPEPYFTKEFGLTADGCTSYKFSVKNNNEEVFYISEDTYIEFTKTDEEGNEIFIDRTPPSVKVVETSNEKFLDLSTLKLLVNYDDDADAVEDNNIYYYWVMDIPEGHKKCSEVMTLEQMISSSGGLRMTYCPSVDEENLASATVENYFCFDIKDIDFNKKQELVVLTYDQNRNYFFSEYDLELTHLHVNSSNVFYLNNMHTLTETVEVALNQELFGYCQVKIIPETNEWITYEGCALQTEKKLDRLYELLWQVPEDAPNGSFARMEYLGETTSAAENNGKLFYGVSYMYIMGTFDNGMVWTMPDFFMGTNGNKIQVVTNQPLFVHTLVSDVDYGSNLQAWERFGVEKNPVVIKSSSDTATYYDVSSESGKYYKVIGYPAIGTSLFTETKFRN